MSGRIAATVSGDGEAVLLLHGQPGSSADWAGVQRLLTPSFKVIAPDRPGYGETGGRALGIRENAAAMAGLLAEMGIERARVAGHSWGAGAALAMAEHHPELVSALVLVCPVTPNDRLGLMDRALADRRAGPPLARAMFAGAGAALSVPQLRRGLGRLLPGYGMESSQKVARDWVSGRAARSFYREQRALFDELPELRRTLSALRAPLTVVIGTRDWVTDTEAGRELARTLDGRLVEVKGAGHLLPMQAPDQVAKAIATA